MSQDSLGFHAFGNSTDQAFKNLNTQSMAFVPGQFESPNKEDQPGKNLSDNDLYFKLVIAFARNRLNPEQEEKQVKEVDEMMKQQGCVGRT
jgi:hypothetical protein